jgi:hypothetical protein
VSFVVVAERDRSLRRCHGPLTSGLAPTWRGQAYAGDHDVTGLDDGGVGQHEALVRLVSLQEQRPVVVARCARLLDTDQVGNCRVEEPPGGRLVDRGREAGRQLPPPSRSRTARTRSCTRTKSPGV